MKILVVVLTTAFAVAFGAPSVRFDKPVNYNHWELVDDMKYQDSIPAFKFKSRRTGLSLTLLQPESPIVDGYFCLATEAFDDDGIPHVLEHLIFQVGWTTQ